MNKSVPKTSVKAPLFKVRRLAVAFVLFFVMQAGWGQYYWTGAAGDGKWSTSGNWNTAPDGTGTTLESGYPNGYDNVRFPKGAEINVDVAPTEINGIYYLYINSLYIPNNNIENSDFTVKLTGNPIYVYDLIEIYRATGPTAGDSKSTLELDCDIVASDLVIHSGTTVQIDSGHTANITNVTNVGGNDYPAKIIVEGSLISDKITLSDNSDRILEITGGSVETGIITGTSNSVINNGSLSISNVSGSDIGVLKAGGNGTLDLNGDNTYIWKGTEDEDWANANNWTGGVPNSDTAVIRIENDSPYPTIKSGDEYEIKSIDNYNQPKINIYGKLKINDDFCYAVGVDSEYTQIDSNGSGVLELTGKFYTKTIFSIGVSIICNDFQTGSNFECENLTVNGNAKIGAMVVTHGFQHYAGTLSGDLNDFDPNDYSDITLISHYNSNNDSNITIAGAVSKITTLQIQGYDDLTIQNTISDIENLILDTSESSSAILNGQVNIKNEFRTSAPVLLKQNVYVGGDVYGPFVSDTGKKLVFNGSENQKFSPSADSSNFSYATIEENKSSGSLTIEDFSNDIIITDFVIEQGVETIFKQGGEITNLTIKNGGTTKFTDNITIDTLTDLSTAGNIIFQDDVTVKNVTGQTFNTTEKIIFDYDANTTFGTSSPYSNIKHVAGPTEIYGQLTVNSIEFGETTIYHWVETNGDQKYTDAVILVGASDSLEGELELISRQGKISFESTINSKENYSVGLGISLQNYDYAISLADSVGLVNPLKYFNVYNPLEIASGCTAITTTGSQGYRDTVTIDEDVTLTSGSTITFASTIDSKTDTTKKITFEVPTDKAISVDGKVGNSKPVAVEVTQAGSIIFNDTVNITEFTDHDDSGDVTFNEDATISNASGTTFNTSGTVTFGNASTDETTFGTSPSSLVALTHSTGPTVLNGTLNASNITLGNTNATPGTISIPSGSISASGTVSLDGALTSSDSVSITAGTLAFNAPVEVKNITMDAVATTSKNITVTGNWTNSKAKNGTTYGFTATDGTVTLTGENPTDSAGVLLSGDNKFKELKIQGNTKITGSNEIETLTANTKADGSSGLGGKQIIFTAGTIQTVNGKITLSGDANEENNRLVLKSSSAGFAWTIKCAQTENNHEINFVELLDSAKLIQDGTTQYNLFAFQSKDSGNNTNWSFPNMTYTWVGGASGNENSWTTKENWSPQLVPTKGSTVKIDVSASGNYPSLLAPVDIKDTFDSQNYGTITVAANAEFDIAGQNLKAVSITNNGKIKLHGTQTITAEMSNGDSDNSTIEYYFTDATTSLNSLNWDINSSGEKKYTNLIISRKVSLTEKLNVTGKTIINGDANLDNENNAIASIKLGDYSSEPKIQAGDVIIKAANAITLDDNAYAKSFDCYRPVNIKNITTSGTQTYRETVTLTKNGETALTAKNGSDEYQTIDFKKDILVSATGAKTLVLAANTTLSSVDASIAPNVQTQADTSFTASSGNTTFKADVVFADGTFNANSGTVIFTAENTIGGAAAQLSGTNTFNNLTINSGANVTTASNMTITGNWTNNKAKDGDNYGFTATGGTVTFTGVNPSAGESSVSLAGANKFYELKIQGPVIISGSNEITERLNVDSGALAINASLTLKDLLIANNANAKITTNSDITVTGNWTNNNSTDGFTANGGTVSFNNKAGATDDECKVYADLVGTNTFNNLSLNRCLNIYNTNTIKNDFTAIKPKQGDFGNLKFATNTEQLVKGKLTIKGLGIGQGQRQSAACITPNGTWKLKCEQAENNHEIQYVNLQGCNNTSGDDYLLIARDSRDTGNNQKIVFLGLQYIWTGKTGNDWNDSSNWASQFDTSGPVSVPEKGSTVIIQSGRTKYPILQNNLNLKLSITENGNPKDYGTITIQAADGTNVQGCLDLAGHDLIVDTITNNGLVRLIGASVTTPTPHTQTIAGTMINGDDSTVEYYGTGATTTNFAWDGEGTTAITGKQYANLILNQDTTSSEILTVSKKLTINNPSTLTGQLTVTGTTTISAGTGKTVSLDNASNTFTGNVIAGNSTGTSFIAGVVTLRAGSPITLANNANADSLTVNSAVKLQKVTTSEDQTYNGPITVNGTTDLIATDADKHIYFNNNVSGTGTLSAQATNININCDTIETTGNQTYTGAVALDKNTELKSTSGGISFTSTVYGAKTLKLTSSSGTTFGGLVGGTVGAATNLTSLEVNGPVTINAASITSSGTQTYNDAVSLEHDTSLSVTSATGTITFASAATIDGTKSLELSATGGTIFGASVGNAEGKALTNLTITGPLSVNCETIKTSGNQTYYDTVTIGINSKFTASQIIYAANITDNNIGKTLNLDTPEFISSIAAGDTPANIILDKLALSRDAQISSTNAAGMNFNVASITGTGKTLTFAGNTTLFTLKDGITVEAALVNNKSVSCAGAASFNGTVENNGALSGDPSDNKKPLTFAKNYSGTGTLTAAKGITTFKADVTLANGTLDANNGTVVLTGTTANGTSQTLTTKTDGSTEFNNLVIKGNVTLNNSNTIANLTAADTEGDDSYTLAGKTITFGAGTTQEVSGKLTLRGSDGNRLNLRSSSDSGSKWKIKCTGANSHDIEFVDVQDGWNTSETGTPTPKAYNLFAITSNDSGNNTNWNFPGMEYVWEGTVNNTWDNAANWKRGSIPGKGADIEIPAGCSYYPELLVDLNLNETYNSTPYNGKITIKPKETGKVEGKLDLAGKNLTLGEITNKGLVRLIGASGQTISGKMINVAGSTVEYYGTGATTTNFAWDGDGTQNGTGPDGKQYANLILNQDTSGSTVLVMSENLKINNPANLSGAVTVGGSLTIAEATTLSGSVSVTGTTTIVAGTGKNVSLNTDSNIFKGNVIVGNDDASNPVNAGAVTLKGIGKDTNNNNVAIFIENNVRADSLTINSNIRGSTLTINAPLAINTASISTTGNQTYKKAVTLLKDAIHLQSTSETGTITFASTAPIDGTKELTISTTAGTTFNANVGNGTELAKLTVEGPLNINCEVVKTSGNQTYNANVNIAFANEATLETTAGDISFTNANANVYGNKLTLKAPAKTISFNGTAGTQANPLTELKITSAAATTFNKAIYITTFSETVDPGTLTFKNGGKIVNPTVFNTTGNVTLTGELESQSLQMNNLIVDGTATIKTSGAQTYNGTINGKTASTDVLNLDSGSGHITFNGDLGQSLPPQTLNVTGETTINCEAITTSGTQTYNSAITLGTAPSPETHTLTASGISFVSTIDGGADLALVTTAGTSFAANIGDTTPPTSLTVTGFTTIGCAAIKTSGDQHYKNAVALTASPTLTSTSGNLTFDSTIDGEQLLTLSVPQNTTSPAATYTITVKGKVGETEIPSVKIAQAGNISFEDTVKTSNFTITKANDSTFDEQVDSSTFVITQADNTLFKKAVNVTGFTITTSSTTTFNETVQISTFVDAATAGDITFKNSGTISTATEFKTTGTVTFGDASADIMTFGSASPYENLTHTAGDTNITGILNAANITLAQTAGGPMTIANSGLFKTVDGEALTYTTSFTQNGTGNSVIGGSFTGNGNASFATNVQIFGNSQADFGSNGTAVSITKNLIILRDATDDLNINSRVNVTENLVLYKGPVVANADITAGKDILILGSAYSTTDTSTGITNEYAYDCVRPETWSQPNYTETLLPDGTAAPSTSSGTPVFTATLSVASAKTITAGKNFYANGTTLSTNGTTGQWTLKVPDLTNAANAFAEAYHSEISGCKVICNDGSSTDGTKSRLVCLECDDTSTTNTPNTNVDFDDFEITAAWTERDNSIRVEFNRPVRYYDATVQTLKFQNADGSPVLNFTGLYSDPDCQNEIVYDSQLSYFYIKAVPQNDSEYGAWNTDATGRSSGAADDQSTDRRGIHHETIPALDFARALINGTTTQSFIFTDRWGKRLNNYSSRTPTAKAAYGSTGDTETTHEVADKTGPVLYSVKTGQELHDAYNPSTGQASEHSYDSHNFIEFVYSEKVDFDGSSDDTTLNDSPATAENVQVNDALGAVKGDITKADNLQLAGLGILEHGLLYTGKNGSADKYVSALYRKGTNAEYAIRLSIAGYTDPSVTLTDDSGYTYKKWIGYIEQAVMPSGTVKHLVDSNKKNERVKDKEGNVQIKYADNSSGEPVFDTIPTINSTEDGTFGAWDLSEPVFALYRQNAAKTHWEQSEFDKNYYAEAIGNNSGVGSTLDRIEFHLYDNTPDFESTEVLPEWFTEVGWCNPNSIGEKPQDLYKSYSYAADIFGGARPFDSNASRRTSGGIRYSTIYSSVNAFKYGVGSALQEKLITTSFNNSKIGIPGASSLIFTGTSSPRRSAGDSEGLYFALPLANTSLDIKTSFTVKYDDSVGFITDLAGNRLRTKIFSTIDRTPPSIDMTVCPVGGDEMEIIFVKELCTDSDDLEYNDNTTGEKVSITEQFDSLITNCFDFITINSSGTHQVATDLTVDHTVPAKITVKENQNGSAFTIIHLKLSRTVTLDDIKNKFIRVIYVEQYGEYSVDLFTGHPGSRVTFIQDENGNNIQMYTAHALSDFAVGIINPLYAYDSAMTEEDGTIISDSLFRANLTDDVDEKGWSVHDWNRDQQNYGTLPAKRPVAIVADTFDGTEENEAAPDSFRVYLSNNPDSGSVSTQYNKDLEPLTEWRIWFPNQTDGVFTSLSEKNNKTYSQVDGTLLTEDKANRMIFDVGQTITSQWSAGNQVSFLFGLTNSDGTPVTIMHSPEIDINNDKQYLSTSAKMPLFALRQTDANDLLSLDLWSFRLKDVVHQRGGVTILNNVINSSQREKVVLKVNQPEQGNLTVLVMTLDGNIVDYLHRGASESGEHFYSWDGTNRKGKSVARGMYFVRVIGPGLDETRKVMVVKD